MDQDEMLQLRVDNMSSSNPPHYVLAVLLLAILRELRKLTSKG